MAKIEEMIAKTNSWRMEHKSARRLEEAWLAATRLHALLDCYKAIGGDVSPWRKGCGVLK